MNRSQVIDAISDETNVSKKDVGAILDAQDKLVTKCLTSSGEITIGKSGKLEAVRRAEREGRNPATGEAMTIPAKTSAKFKPSKELKNALG